MCVANGIDVDTPFKNITKDKRDIIFNGTDGKKFKVKYSGADFNYNGERDFEGIIKNIERRYYETNSDSTKEEIEQTYMVERVCKVCKGKKLKPEVLAIDINGKNIIDATELSVKKSLEFFNNLEGFINVKNRSGYCVFDFNKSKKEFSFKLKSNHIIKECKTQVAKK
jgi:excinuclease ABC subunit A